MDAIFLFISLLGLILSLLLFVFKKGYGSSNIFLAGFFFFISLYLLDTYIVLFSKSTFWVTIFITLIPSFFYIIGPLSFFYVRSITRDNSNLSLLDYLHFGFLLIVIVGSLPYVFSSWEYREGVAKILISNNWEIKHLRLNVIIPHFINQGFKPIHWLIYGCINWGILIKHYKKPVAEIKNIIQYQSIKKWLILFCINFSLLGLVLLFIMVSNFIFVDKVVFLNRTYYFLVVFSFAYVLLNFSLLFFPQILYGLPIESLKPILLNELKEQTNDSMQLSNFSINENDVTSEEGKQKYSQIFSPEYLSIIKEKLYQWEIEDHYIKPGCDFGSLSKEIKIPAHHLTFYFNSFINIKFIDWRNNLRVNYACKIIESGGTDIITIEALAFQCGFSAQSTFIRAFKTFKGLTPSEYIKQLES
jgi:AraC-like DNA-binding protein